MESKSHNDIENFKIQNIKTIEDYISYIESLNSNELLSKIYEKEKIINNFHIKAQNDSELEVLRYFLITLNLMIDLLDSLNESTKSQINWREVLKNLIFEKISINFILRNTIRETKRKNSFNIQKAIKDLLNEKRISKNKSYTQKSIIEFIY